MGYNISRLGEDGSAVVKELGSVRSRLSIIRSSTACPLIALALVPGLKILSVNAAYSLI